MNTENKLPELKKDDVKNRRLQERKPTSFHDVTCARLFTIGESTAQYKIKSREYTNDYAVYHIDFNGSVECIGFAEPDRNKIEIFVHRSCLDWKCRVALRDITCYGTKLPKD